MAAVDLQPALPVAFKAESGEPYSYAAEQALSEQDLTVEELEAAVKETPPRPTSILVNGHKHSNSEPRALGDVMDESEKMLPPGSPSLRHTKGRLEHRPSSPQSFASVVKHEPGQVEDETAESHGSTVNGIEREAGQKAETGGQSASIKEEANSDHTPVDSAVKEETYAGVVKHEPTSPTLAPVTPQKKNKAKAGEDETSALDQHLPLPESLRTDKTSTTEQPKPSTTSQDRSQTSTSLKTEPADDSKSEVGEMVYENYRSRSGTNLASIALGQEYENSLAQAELEEKKDSSDTAVSQSSKPQLVSGRQAGAGWSRSAVRWAPHNVPLQRRLQTLAVLAHSLSIASFVAFFFFLCAIPIFWPIIVPYLIYVLLSTAATDGKLSHRSEWIRRSKFWSLFASYFPARLHRSVELEPTRKYIFGYHPHGIISHGAFAAFTTEALGFGSLFPGITNTLLTLDSNFRIPLYRDWALRLGLASVSRESCENILSKGGPNGEGMGRAITIVVGGARESLDAKPGTLKLVLAKRKGFIKLAVRTGADLVPVLAFGENDMYEQIGADTHPWIHKAQMALKKFMGFTVPLFHARGVFNYDVGIMPYRRPVNIVVGRPIQTLMAKSPDPAYVDELHKQYTDELLHIWHEWKDTFAPDRKQELQIVE